MTGLHTTPSNSFGMNQNTDVSPTLSATICVDLINALVTEIEQIPGARFQNLVENPPKKRGGCYNSILMLTGLITYIMVCCLGIHILMCTFGHVVYFSIGLFNV